MKTVLKVCGGMLLAGLLLSVAIVAIGAALWTPLEHAVIDIDGDSLTLGALHGADWLVAVVAVLAAVVVVVLVVPFAVLIPLLVAAFAIGAALLAVLGVMALAFSPFLLLVWLVWRVARRDKPQRDAERRRYDRGMNTRTVTRALIADDERLLRDQLRARLAEVWPELEIVAEAKNGIEAVELTEQHHPALVFLDIRMPGMTGVEAARAIAQLPTDDDTPDGWSGCEVVFITAYDQYAIEAFEQGVVDYVLKPAERERLTVTVERIKKRLAQRPGGADSTDAPQPAAMQQLLQKLASHMNPQAAPHLRWIQATVGQNIQMIPVEEVLFFISDEKYTRVQTATLEALIRKPIKELVEELDADMFWQIHRSTLVNTRFIAGVSRDLRGRQLVAVKGHPEILEVSRSFTGLFKGM